MSMPSRQSRGKMRLPAVVRHLLGTSVYETSRLLQGLSSSNTNSKPSCKWILWWVQIHFFQMSSTWPTHNEWRANLLTSSTVTSNNCWATCIAHFLHCIACNQEPRQRCVTALCRLVQGRVARALRTCQAQTCGKIMPPSFSASEPPCSINITVSAAATWPQKNLERFSQPPFSRKNLQASMLPPSPAKCPASQS